MLFTSAVSAAVIWASGQAEPQEATHEVEQVDGILSGQQARPDATQQAGIPTCSSSKVLLFLADLSTITNDNCVYTPVSVLPMCSPRLTGHLKQCSHVAFPLFF